MSFFDPTTIGLLVVAAALLVVIIFFMSYFNTLLLIAYFAYPNARVKAIGTVFLNGEKLKKLMESGSRDEFVDAVRSEGYPIPSGETDADAVESQIELKSFESARETAESAPYKAKAFFEAYMRRYDIEAIRAVLRAKMAGKNADTSSMPVYMLDRKILADMADASDMEGALGVLQGSEYFPGNEEEIFLIDVALDRIFFKILSESAFSIDHDVSRRVMDFSGKLLDVTNIRSMLRAKNMGLSGELAMKAVVGEGKEIAEWKLKNMADATDLERAVGELAGTRYGEILKGSESIAEMELALDGYLLKAMGEMETQYSLDIGPTMYFLIAKEFEKRNLLVLNRALDSGMKWKDVEPLLVTEEKK